MSLTDFCYFLRLTVVKTRACCSLIVGSLGLDNPQELKITKSEFNCRVWLAVNIQHAMQTECYCFSWLFEPIGVYCMPMKFAASMVSSSHFIKLVFHRQSKKYYFIYLRRKLVQDVHKDLICPCQLNIFVFSLSHASSRENLFQHQDIFTFVGQFLYSHYLYVGLISEIVKRI